MNRHRNTTRKKSDGEELILTAEEDSTEELTGTLQLPEVHLDADSDEFDEQVQQAQEQLQHLREQQEMIEKQKSEIEELKRQRHELSTGRADISEKLSRATVMLEREIYDSQKKAEQFAEAKEAFTRHIETVGEVKPEDWSREDMRGNLTHSLGVIDDAKEEYRTIMARVSSLLDGQTSSEFMDSSEFKLTNAFGEPQMEADWFRIWMRRGFAFSIPLMGFGVFALLFNAIFG